LVDIACIANFFQKKEAIGSLVGRDTCKETWGVFSLKRSEQSVGSKFSIENVELFSPLLSLRNFCADFEDVLLGVTQASGTKGLAEKAEIGCGAEKEASGFQGAFLGIWRIWPGRRIVRRSGPSAAMQAAGKLGSHGRRRRANIP
jgi:hypothetical protein